MAFYDDMATVVTELLTEFGATVTLVRTSDTYDSITGKSSGATTTDYDTIGVWRNIDARLVDGTRIRQGDKEVVIDASVEPLMGDVIDGWQILSIHEINPAGTVLAYVLTVRK